MIQVTCRRCGKALGNEQATCPFCGAFIAADQVSQYRSMKKEQGKDLRPKLISERYGMDPIQYELQNTEVGSKLIFLLLGIGVVAIIFLVVLLILF